MGPIHLNEVQCTGTEKSIIECKLNTEAQGCNHEEDAGVRCNIPIMGFQKKVGEWMPRGDCATKALEMTNQVASLGRILQGALR